MATNYPDALDTSTELPSNRTDATPSATNHAEDHNDLAAAVVAIEAELGTTPSGASATVAARLDAVESSILDARLYGALADGDSHPIIDGFANLAAAQVVYPFLTETDWPDAELDWAAAQKAANVAGARSVMYVGEHVWNRMLRPADGQEHFCRGPGDTIRNTHALVGARLWDAGFFELGNMHPIIMNLTQTTWPAPTYDVNWDLHGLDPIIAGDRTVIVTTPGAVPDGALDVGTVLFIRSDNPPATAGNVGATYDFGMWNEVVSWDDADGELVLRYDVPVSIAATGTPTELYGPTLCLNAGSDPYRGTEWWTAKDVTLRDLNLVGGSFPIGSRSGAMRCKIRNITMDGCQGFIANALAYCDAENIRGSFSYRWLEIKQASHGSSFERMVGTFRSDPAGLPTWVPTAPIGIGEQCWDLDVDVEVNVGREFTGAVRMADLASPRVRFRGVLNHLGSGGHGDVIAISSTAHPARPPADIDAKAQIRSAGGIANYLTIGGGAGDTRAVTALASTDTFTDAGHDFAANTPINFPSLTGGAPLNTLAVYYVVNPVAGTSYQVALTSGGAAVNLTMDVTAGTVRRNADPARIAYNLNARVRTGAAPANAVKAVRGTFLREEALVADIQTTSVVNPAETPEGASQLLAAVAGSVTYTVAAGATLVGTYNTVMRGMKIGDHVEVSPQTIGTFTAGALGNLELIAIVDAAGSIKVYARAVGADVTITGATAYWIWATWKRNRA